MDIVERSFAGFTVRSISVSEMQNNVYLVTADGADTHVLVDAADDLPAIRSLIDAAGGGTVDAILTTHRHWDHVRALAEATRELTDRTIAGVDDAEAIAEESGAVIAETVEHDDVLVVGGLSFACIALRGHTPGSIAFVLTDDEGQDVILSGDSLFPGGPGKTWSEPDFDSLMDDLEERIFGRFGDDALVLPGHGDSTTLGAERPHLGEWRARRW